jgi:hypothetical protein
MFHKHPVRYIVSFTALTILGIGNLDAVTCNDDPKKHSNVCRFGVSHDLGEELSLHDDEEFLYH